jgi:hypothetical protein
MIRFRFGIWPALAASSLLIFLYLRIHPPHNDIPASLDFLPPPLPEEFNVLHPGEFTDPTPYPEVHVIPSPSDPADEPEEEGTLNDIPYGIVFVAEHSTNKVAGSISSIKEGSLP